ncbi:MAG: hypothetical protein NTY05_03260 [Rhodocyclales bacterium]|nr:hypothetical protein [Rhodocyclales bacterium]
MRRSGLLLGREAGCRSAPCFGFLFGSVTGFARRLLFCRCSRQGGGFSDLFGTQLPGRQFGRASLGFGPRQGRLCQLFFCRGPSRGCASQFSSG